MPLYSNTGFVSFFAKMTKTCLELVDDYRGLILEQDSYVVKLLEEADWETLSRRMLGFAVRCGWNYSWNIAEAGSFGNGVGPKDIVQQVIMKAFSGERRWNPSKVSLDVWLFGQIRSEIDNLYSRQSQQREVAFVPLSEDVNEGEVQDVIEYKAIQSGGFPQSVPPMPEQELLRTEQWNAVFAAIEGDTELEMLLVNITEVGMKPQDLAEVMGKPVVEINNLLRKFDRRTRKLRDND